MIFLSACPDNSADRQLLTDLVGADLWTLDREMEKLSLYASGRTIEESDVGKLVSQVREANIFSAVDAMIDGRPAVALRLFLQLRQDGRDVSNIIAMVERQLRLLALARDSMDRGLPQADLGNIRDALVCRLLFSSYLQGRQTCQDQDYGNNPEAHNHTWFRPAFQFEVVVDRRHTEYSAARQLE